MGVVFACIAPHGTETISELAGNMIGAFSETRKGVEELAGLMRDQKPETIVLATPHNLRLEATIGVITSQYAEGVLEANNKQVKLRCECDRELSRELLKTTKESGLMVVGANYGSNEGLASCMPMDWGTLIPLWFLAGKGPDAPKIVIVTPSREIPLDNLIRFGETIFDVAESSGKRVAFVASADQGHAHQASGPYGFHTASKQFDEIVKKAVMTNDLSQLFNLPQQFIEDAKPDSVWQLAILHGILRKAHMDSVLLSYQTPTYYGMLCAAYLPKKSR